MKSLVSQRLAPTMYRSDRQGRDGSHDRTSRDCLSAGNSEAQILRRSLGVAASGVVGFKPWPSPTRWPTIRSGGPKQGERISHSMPAYRVSSRHHTERRFGAAVRENDEPGRRRPSTTAESELRIVLRPLRATRCVRLTLAGANWRAEPRSPGSARATLEGTNEGTAEREAPNSCSESV